MPKNIKLPAKKWHWSEILEYLAFKESNCKNCHKCIRHCPVKAISFSDNQAHILENDCILCGNCYVFCPQNAKTVKEDINNVKNLIDSGERVYASVAPSFAAAFNTGFDSLRNALLDFGFFDAEETAIGATIVKQHYEQLVKSGQQDIIISSCCHSVNLLIQKYFPSLRDMLAKCVSPMVAHALKIRKADPKARVVFIGPCISKKDEVRRSNGAVDYALTFDELSDALKNRAIDIAPTPLKAGERGRARIFPTTGGVIKSMELQNATPATGVDYTYIAIDGAENCLNALKDIAKGNLSRCFIEMSACYGSCVNGPIMEKHSISIVKNMQSVYKISANEDLLVDSCGIGLEKTFNPLPIKQVEFSQKAVEGVLAKMGKTLPEHELNCGFCGYDTCKDKAHAILVGKAESSMCLPHLMTRAESFSDNIIANSPNGIIVLSRSFDIEQINKAACNLVNIKDMTAVLGRNVVCILDPSLFADAIISKCSIKEKLVYLAEYEKYALMTAVYDKNSDKLLIFTHDVTSEKQEEASKAELSKKTVEIADRVIEKQMRTVQEIASLLGETTAETKVALEKLKGTLSR